MHSTTLTTVCPPWCINPHTADSIHLETATAIPTDTTGLLDVSAYQHANRVGVYAGAYELTPAQARQVAAALLNSADAADSALTAVTA